MDEYELYVLSKIPAQGIREEELKSAAAQDIEQGVGPFSSYSQPSYGKKRFNEVLEHLLQAGYLSKENATIKLTESAQKVLSYKKLVTPQNVELLLRDFYSKGHILKLSILQLAAENLDYGEIVEKLAGEGWSKKAVEAGLSDLAVRGFIRSAYQAEIPDHLRKKVQDWFATWRKEYS